ncbi:iron dicitrate transporter FecR [Fulvitalea axinellae]|uniref:Iron dicitrate transporter FecR n=1 Tax=Fulvitalea axinellae TaxID=1182444 RepID=A0AAU9CZL9_9BACT|nr:iron dicitrate transporter FecR [Fulvitalea axinellae]
MERTEDYIRFTELLLKESAGNLTQDETEELALWIARHPEDGELGKRLADPVNLAKKQAEYADINTAKAWERLEREVEAKERKSERRILTFVKYAAACLVPLLVFVLYKHYPQQRQLVTERTGQTEIQPGSNKAILVLGDGQTVSLENKGDTLIADNIRKKGDKLIYGTEENEPEKEMERWHTLVTPVGGEYKLALPDGSEVWLNAASELRYSAGFSGKRREVWLKGEACFNVAKDLERPFVVKTEDMDVRVFGTEFNVMAYSDDGITQTTLLEGSVKVDIKDGTEIIQTEELVPDTQAEFRKGSAKANIKKVKALYYTGWKNGKFQFDDEKLETIFRKLSRWYNVEFEVRNPEISDIRFSGEIRRFGNFSTVLGLLELGADLRFSVKGNKITVTKEGL